jgi:hypothetical protein
MNGNFETNASVKPLLQSLTLVLTHDFNTLKIKTAVIVLKSDSENLEEVVVNSLGTKKRRNL